MRSDMGHESRDNSLRDGERRVVKREVVMRVRADICLQTESDDCAFKSGRSLTAIHRERWDHSESGGECIATSTCVAHLTVRVNRDARRSPGLLLPELLAQALDFSPQ